MTQPATSTTTTANANATQNPDAATPEQAAIEQINSQISSQINPQTDSKTNSQSKPPHPTAPIDQHVVSKPVSKSVFWLGLAFLCTFSGLTWLGVIEMANDNAGRILQTLNGTEADRQAFTPPISDPWWSTDVSEESLREQIAVDEAGQALPDPLPLEIREDIEAAWRPYATRRHLRLMLVGFGPMLYPLTLGGILAGLLVFRHQPSTIVKTISILLIASAAFLTWRAFSLGVLQHGLLS